MTPDSEFIYHGSHERFEIAVPKRQRRVRNDIEIFNQISFHATPYYWIALAYICQHKPYVIDGKNLYHTMGVDLYMHDMIVVIHGFESLEKSLETMYGEGGYVYVFKKEDFLHMEGLGNLEVIIQKDISPIRVDRIDNPVEKMKELGVQFEFKDLANEKLGSGF